MPGGRAFVAVAAQREPFIHYWDATTGEALKPPLTGSDCPLKTITSLTLKDGTILIAAQDEAATVYRLVAATGEPFGSPSPMGSDVGAIAAACPNHSALLFVSTGVGPTLILDAVTGETADPPIPGNNPAALACPDGSVLLATVRAADDHAALHRLTQSAG